ncbi:LysM domain-containing protein [Dysgonomonas sp. 521]|uniref:LysM peptidoglycan-binding domain-containing protein n=1 Tax=Dysgonomonas sp. 521 TaxID=2302932 RepID=UPI0013D71C26|nr:LysM domain-containing protein [Dysgonomonas sp. 521]NDV95716.1 LysM domain-containing protein [Dysgonomonas sp. 521]
MKLKQFFLTLMLITGYTGYLCAQQVSAIQQPIITDGIITHIVASGETIHAIAATYHTSVQEVYKLNPEARRGIIAGDRLSLRHKPLTGYNHHLIETNETLYSVSKAYKVSVNDVKEANPGLDEKTFHIGKTIKIPVFGDKTYVVKEGETIYDVAVANNVSVEKLIAINPVLMRERVKDNMILVIPH